MRKNYEVLLKAYSVVVVVGARNEDHALEIACEEVSRGDFDIEESTIDRELKTDRGLANAKRQANRISLPGNDV